MRAVNRADPGGSQRPRSRNHAAFDRWPSLTKNARVTPFSQEQTTLTRTGLIILCATIFLSVSNASMTTVALPRIAADRKSVV